MFNFFKKKANNKLFYSTEVHCHIMPGVDHGATDVQNGLELMRAEMDMGITNLIFTPHVTKSTFENTPDTILPAFDTFKKAITENGINAKVSVSAEYRLDELSLEQIKSNQYIAMPKEHILLENAYQQERIDLDQILFDIQIKNLTPIMAHPERFPYYGQTKERFTQLHNAGALFQVNLMSFTGYFGRTAKHSAEWLLEHDLIDFLGSDVHNMEHIEVIREFIKSKNYKKIESKLKGRLLNDTLL